MSDPQKNEQEQRWMRYWQESKMDERNPVVWARELAGRVRQFDRKIFWRNFREYAACLLVLIWASYGAYKGSRSAIALMAGVVFIMAYMWWRHRNLKPLDPALSVGAYRKALVERFDDQIRLLSRVRYWYLMPLYIPAVWQMLEGWPQRHWLTVIPLAIVTGVFVFIGWLNEKCAVRFLQAARARVLDEPES